MGCIVCATRGGAGSRANQERAIELASEGGHRLVFLLVIDTVFFGEVDAGLQTAVEDELRWVGRTLLNLAVQRALGAEVKAEVLILQGNALEEIERYLGEAEAELLLLGAPRSATDSVFGDDPVERFAESIRSATGVRVEVVYPEPVLERARGG